MNQRSEEVFDWATTDWPQQATNAPAVYQPQPLVQMPQVPPNVRVIDVPGQQPYYAYQPAPLPAHDPLPQRMYGCGVMAFGIGVGGSLLEAASWIMFKGMSMAEHAIIGISIAVALAAAAIVALKLASGIRVSNVHIGNNSSFNIGSQK